MGYCLIFLAGASISIDYLEALAWPLTVVSYYFLGLALLLRHSKRKQGDNITLVRMKECLKAVPCGFGLFMIAASMVWVLMVASGEEDFSFGIEFFVQNWGSITLLPWPVCAIMVMRDLLSSDTDDLSEELLEKEFDRMSKKLPPVGVFGRKETEIDE